MTRLQKFEKRYPIHARTVLSSIAKVGAPGGPAIQTGSRRREPAISS